MAVLNWGGGGVFEVLEKIENWPSPDMKQYLSRQSFFNELHSVP